MAAAAMAVFAGDASAEVFGFEAILGGIALVTELGDAAVFCVGTGMGMDRSATFGESELALAHKRSALLPEEPDGEDALFCIMAA